MSILKVGIVGCGEIAGWTAFVSKLIRQVSVSACCDVIDNRARLFAKRHRIRSAYSDYREMLEKEELDAIYLAVPHHLHYEMVTAALEADKPVLIEKPLTRTLEEGIQLIEKAADQKVGVNYQHRYDRGCYALARAVQSGVLGKIHSVRINIPWHRDSKYFERAPWHKTIAQAGGGTLITQGSHFLDIGLWALNEAPVAAFGVTKSLGFDVDVDTLTHGIVETEAGTLINITSSMVAAQKQAVSIEIYGEQGTARFRDLPFPRVSFYGVSVRKERPPEWGFHALQRSLAGFAHWVLDDMPYLIPAEETLPVLATVEAIYRSAKSGQRESVSYPFAGE